jgi:hypothetical protein
MPKSARATGANVFVSRKTNTRVGTREEMSIFPTLPRTSRMSSKSSATFAAVRSLALL